MKNKHKKLFSLIEVVIAMGVFLFACSALLGVMMSTTNQNVDTAKTKQTGMIAVKLMAEIKKDAYDEELGGAATTESVSDDQYTNIMYNIDFEPLQDGYIGRYVSNIYTKLTPKPNEPNRFVPKDENTPDQVYTMLIARKSHVSGE